MTHLTGIEIARKFQSILKENAVPFVNVYLFGSFSRGEETEGSDIDIAVVVPPYKENAAEESFHIFSLACTVDSRIETLCFRPEDMKNKYSSIVQEIKERGVRV
jgi:predicted nucleotidyltransferase